MRLVPLQNLCALYWSFLRCAASPKAPTVGGLVIRLVTYTDVCSRRDRQNRLAHRINPALKRHRIDLGLVPNFRKLDEGDSEAYTCTCGGGFVQNAGIWWVWVDLNHRPHPYQGCALTN